MDARWERIPVNKVTATLILVVVFLIALIAVIASSIVKIDGDEVGIVEKKLFGGSLPEGKVLAINAENGVQAQILAPGWHVKWRWQYNVTQIKMTEIKTGFVGLIQAADGQSLPAGAIYAPEWKDPEKMLNAEYFLAQGKGYKGPQLSVLSPGRYRINTKLFTITTEPITNVKVGTVVVIKSNVGEAVDSEDRLVEVGQKGVWKKPLTEGKYRLHTKAYEATPISIRQVKVSYTAEKEQGEGEAYQPMKPITVRSKDGFTFPVDVRMTYKINSDDAPRVVATVGDDALVLTKLVTPAVRAIFRNNAEKVKALEYVQNRSKQESQSTSMLKEELAKYGVTVLAVRVGDIGDEKSLGLLLKTQTDREIALQEQATFEEQQRAAEKQKELTKTRQEAEEEKRLATAMYNVQIAEQDKLKKIIGATAEAELIKVTAEAKALAYKKISEVIGANNAALIEIMKLVETGKIRITPEVMVGGAGAGMTDALMGTVLRGMLDKEPASEKK
ncbi:MAG TPA: SPFH domain-containing protein [Sedimentisphaerales bacterium]|nr:SPFH domain-containing protein [Sedimentisphaerales bacterium]